MKPKELLIIGLAYLIGVPLIYVIARQFTDNASDMSQCLGALACVQLASWLYYSRNAERAPADVKWTVGGTLAVLCVLQGLTFQLLFHWMTYPDVAITCGAIGSLIIPFFLWTNVRAKTPPKKK